MVLFGIRLISHEFLVIFRLKMKSMVPVLASKSGEPNINELNWDILTDKEKITLLAMLAAKNDAEAIRLSPVGKTQFYVHKKKLEAYKQQLISGLLGKSLEVLQANSIKAAETLTELLDSPNPKIRKEVAESILDRSIGKARMVEQPTSESDVANQETREVIFRIRKMFPESET